MKERLRFLSIYIYQFGRQEHLQRIRRLIAISIHSILIRVNPVPYALLLVFTDIKIKM